MTKHISPVPREARPYQGLTAGLISRVVANVIDGAVIVAMLLAGYLAFAAIRFMWKPVSFHFPRLPLSTFILLGCLLAIAYFTFAWSGAGRSYGDFVMGLRVTNHMGNDIRWTTALLRAIFYVVLPIGLLWAAISRKNHSIQDIVLGTLVIYDWHRSPISDVTHIKKAEH